MIGTSIPREDLSHVQHALATGAATPPLEGARFDFAFEGDVCGPRIAGKLTGIDYAGASTCATRRRPPATPG